MNASAERRGLGRGLGELFQRTEAPPPSTPDPAAEPVGQAETPESVMTADAQDSAVASGPAVMPEGATYAEISVDGISPNPRQPRSVFDDDALAELVESIREVGLLQPVVVRPLGDQRYELVMGERRWRASQAAGLPTIPAIIRRTEDHDLLRDALLENLHRAQLNPLEEAAAYQQMLEDFACTQDELATRIKRSRPQISNTIRLLRLPPSVQRRVAAGVLTAGHARAILGLTDQPAQERLAQRIVAEGLSVRAVEEIVTVGDAAEDRPRTTRSPRTADPHRSELAGQLAERLETRVRIDGGRKRGRIVIEFGDDDDLDRLLELINR